MGVPINPNFPTSVSTGAFPVEPSMKKPFRNWNEAYQTWADDSLRGGGMTLPLSAYLANIDPGGGYGGGGGYGRLPGPLYPTMRTTQRGTTSESTENVLNEALNALQTRQLPPEARAQLQDLIGRLTGQTEFGYTPEERARMEITPEQEREIIGQAQRPIRGVMDRSQGELLRAAAARGNYAPGLNATIERIQQEAGRQSSQAALAGRLGVENLRRAGTQTMAQARLGERGQVNALIANILSNYPEYTSATDTTRAATEAGTTTGTTDQTTEVRTPAGGGGGGGGGGAAPGGGVGGGRTGLAPKRAAPAPAAPGAAPAPTGPGGWGGGAPRQPKQKQTWGGNIRNNPLFASFLP